MKKSDKSVTDFYTGSGWETDGGATKDARKFEDLRSCAKEYVSKCRLRVLDHIPATGENILDMASGPIQYEEYLEYSKNFKKRYCVDLSSKALSDAEKKIGDHGEYWHGDFLEMDLPANFFDCSISIHTIYHIDKDNQEAAVRKLLEVTKPGAPVIIIYSNPDTIMKRLHWIRGKTKHQKKNQGIKDTHEESEVDLYFHAHPLAWWARFKDVATVQILPWRTFASHHQKRLFPNNWIGKRLLPLLYILEESLPNIFVKYFQYPMIILKKK
jgi:ubiquinone/menaquinone biosynthesis C-methylase UbiE